MTRLFDASSLVDALLTGEVAVTFDHAVLDLTPYEVGNAIWKNHHLRSEIGTDRLRRLLELIDELLGHVTVEPVDVLDLDHVMTIAIDESVTFYDAAYVVCAQRETYELVTEDAELAHVASQYVDVTSIEDL